MDRTKLVIGIVIAVLLVFSVVQIVTISNARAEIKQQSGYGAPLSGGAAGAAPAPNPAPANYGGMVGGC